MRLPTFLLLCLLLIAAYDAAMAARRQFQLRALPPSLAVTHPADLFAAQLDSINDPAELRRLALARHRSLLEADHTSQTLLETVKFLSCSDLVQSAVSCLLALGIYISGRRSPRF